MSGEPFDLGAYTVYRGDAWSLTIDAFQADGTTPLDLTTYGAAGGWTAQYRASEDASTAGTITLGTGSLASGVLTLALDTTATTAMGSNATWLFDIQVTGGGVTPITVYRGRLNVVKDVTHS